MPSGQAAPPAAVPRGMAARPPGLPLHRNPFRLALSASLWRSAWLLICYLVLGCVFWSVVITSVTVTAALAITLAGIPLLIVTAAVIRGCAEAERLRLRGALGQPLHGGYRPVPRPGTGTGTGTGMSLLARARVRWRDPATWRDVAYLAGMFIPLWILGLAVVTIWLVLIGCITLPIWYRYPEQTFGNGQRYHGVQFGYFPNGPHGAGAAGFYVDTMPKALLAAGAGLVAFLLFNYVVVITARLHARVARDLLGPPSDPLARAREVLSRPGPLPPLGGTSGSDAARTPGAPRPRHPADPALPRTPGPD